MISTQPPPTNTTQAEWLWAAQECRAPRVRSMREFAEQEIVLPDGPFTGLPFRVERMPHVALWLAEVDSGSWNEIVSTGPTQTGKSLLCYVLPIVYHLCELRENVICGLPIMDMADEKWAVDVEPVFQASRFAALLPSSGPGSRGGSIGGGKPIRLRNGTKLKFMAGGGKDKQRAGSTARVVVITETDGLDETSATSREADKIKQLEGRTRAYGDRRIIYKECTVSLEKGHTWQRYQAGTCSRIVLPCPHCKAWVSPEREHLHGWQSAETELEARQQGAFFCPACGQEWTEPQRRDANLQCRLLHRGQEITADGQVLGDPPPTRTLGYRWSAVHNMFTTAADLGAEEWKAARATDHENAEKEMRQFVWCLPYTPPAFDVTPLDADQVRRRFRLDFPKGLVPADSDYLTVGLDLGKRVGHWVTVGWQRNATGHVVDYGTIEIPSDSLGVERAMLAALRDFRDRVLGGWLFESKTGAAPRIPEQVFIDAGYLSHVVYAFLREKECGRRFRPTLGRGASQQNHTPYSRPRKTNNEIKLLGEEYHVVWFAKDGVFVVECNADYWKTWVHERLATPAGEPGALTFYHASNTEHVTIAKHLTAEKQQEEFVPGRGTIVRWIKEHRSNHFLDSLSIACVAGHLCGARLVSTRRPPTAPRGEANHAKGFTLPDGRPYLITERTS